MRMNYKTYPTDYVQQLNTERGVKGRKKSRAFLEYWNDMEHGNHNSEPFYAKSWEVSNSTAHTWIKEFMYETELFLSHWDIRNKQHYKYAQNQTERQVSKTRGYKAEEKGLCKDSTEKQPREALNLYNNNKIKEKFFWNDKDFNDLFFVYGANTKYKGKKEEAYEVFKHTDIDINLLKLSAMKYLHDPDTEGKRYNLTNFLKNQTYLSYMPKMIKIQVEGKWMTGLYDDKTMIFAADDNKFVGTLTTDRLLHFYEKGLLEFINPSERRVS